MNRKRKFRCGTYRNSPFRPKDRVHRDQIFLRIGDLKNSPCAVPDSRMLSHDLKSSFLMPYRVISLWSWRVVTPATDADSFILP
jgi:hypothetical protein